VVILLTAICIRLVDKPQQRLCACVQCAQQDEAWNEGAIYLALLAVSFFRDTHGRAPGATAALRDSAWELDIRQLQQIACQLWAETGVASACIVSEDLLTEVCRCAGGSLHAMGAVVGGAAAQEAIKVLLRQFVPVGGVLVFDGVRGSLSVLDV
jgi:NEDD8-activating enzyme E1 regulatory subunit